MISNKTTRYDAAYLRLAESWAKLSHCARKQVGAIIVKDEMIISDGYNGSSAGPLSVANNITVSVSNNSIWTIF